MRQGWESEAPSRLTVDRGGLRLTFHSEHRPLESYLRALEQAGLLTETIREPRVPSHLVARDPGERRWQRIPRSCTSGLSSQRHSSSW